MIVPLNHAHAQPKKQASMKSVPQKTDKSKTQQFETLKQKNDQPVTNEKGYNLKDWIEIGQSILTSLAILIGGLWAIIVFILKREKHPHANMTHIIKHFPIDDENVLLWVKVQIENKGNILMQLTSGFTRIQSVLPLSNDIKELIQNDKLPMPENPNEVPWPLIEEIEIKFEEKSCEIEPNERDELIFEFIFSSNEQVVSIYTYLENIKKRESELGWGLTSIYDFRESDEDVCMNNKKNI
jgi:hypothetical protein